MTEIYSAPESQSSENPVVSEVLDYTDVSNTRTAKGKEQRKDILSQEALQTRTEDPEWEAERDFSEMEIDQTLEEYFNQWSPEEKNQHREALINFTATLSLQGKKTDWFKDPINKKLFLELISNQEKTTNNQELVKTEETASDLMKKHGKQSALNLLLNDQKYQEQLNSLTKNNPEHLQKLQTFQRIFEGMAESGLTQTDQQAVQKIFESADYLSSPTGLTAFVQDVAQDENISQEAKDYVQRMSGYGLKSGTEINNELAKTTVDPKTGETVPVYNEDHPLPVREGIQTYKKPNDPRAYLRIEGVGDFPIETINGKENETMMKMVRFALLEKTINEATGGFSHLLLGGERRATNERATDEVNNKVHIASIYERSQQIYEALLPGVFTDDRIPTQNELADVGRAFDAMIENRSQGDETIVRNNLAELQIVEGDEGLQQNGVNQLKNIGRFLRQNNYLVEFSETRENDDAYSMLTSIFAEKKE